MAKVVFVMTLAFALLHVISGLVSICVGVAASVQAELWLAHTASPIWSGAFFTMTGLLGLACAKRSTAYWIMSFAAFSVVSLVTAVVSIQLLRLGLVSRTPTTTTSTSTAVDRPPAPPKDVRPEALVLVALTVTSVECALCIGSSFISCRLAKDAKEELQRNREGINYHVQVLGEKDAMVGATDANGSSEKPGKIFTMST